MQGRQRVHDGLFLRYGIAGRASSVRPTWKQADTEVGCSLMAQCARALGAGTLDEPARSARRRDRSALSPTHADRRGFRDTKSPVFGMGSPISRSPSALRLQALLLIGTLAAYLLWHIVQVAESEGLLRSTTCAKRELSLLTLARLLCERLDIPLSSQGVATLQNGSASQHQRR